MKNNFPEIKQPISIMWHRRDLRIQDNAALYHALKGDFPILSVFIFDSHILNKLDDKSDARVNFIHQQLMNIHAQLETLQSSMLILYGNPEQVWEELCNQYNIQVVYTNKDYEPYAKQRDLKIENILHQHGIELFKFKDQVIFEENEIMSDTGNPYKVYTPYKNKWLSKLNAFYLQSYPVEKYQKNYLKIAPVTTPSLADIGFLPCKISFPSNQINASTLIKYHLERDFPHLQSTSMLGLHLRFGTVSVRLMASMAKEINAVWLSEFIWREFFMQLMYHFPEVKEKEFNPRFRNFPWRKHEEDFKKWCAGKTGYPMVDAGMRQLNATGYMHNRVRMVVASFLCKHLLIDWRWGEAYFAQKLLDFDLSANNGNWQWSAGTGADAQPFFRIFNPQLQQEKFDAELKYIKKWIPEFGTHLYPAPIIDHKQAVQRAKENLAKISI
jgi:deoxyribodipyrimidine photo-lyase